MRFSLRFWKCVFVIQLATFAAQHQAQGAEVAPAGRSSLAKRAGAAQLAQFPRLAATSFAGGLEKQSTQELLAKYDLVLLGTGGAIPDVVRSLKRLNPTILVGAYTVLNESRKNSGTALTKERLDKLEKENWWLREADGKQARWTTEFETWDINVTEWAKPDAAGKRYPEWAADLWFRHLFQPVPEFDIWFFDNVFVKQRIASADWQLKGRNQSGNDPVIQAAFRKGQALEFKEARRLAPDVLLVGNTDNDLSTPEYKGALNGALMECLMGQRWSIESWGGWQQAMTRYKTVMENLGDPKLVIFGACLPDISDYRFFRYAFATSLLGDAYFQLSDSKSNYQVWPWFDEFGVKLGKALDPAFPPPTKEGVYLRQFERGMALLNPSNGPLSVTIPPGYRRILGKQDPATNTGQPVTEVRLQGKHGLILVKI